MEKQGGASEGGRWTRPRIWLGFLAAGLTGALAGGTIFSASRAFAHGGFGRGGHGFGHHGRFGGDPEQMRQHAEIAVEWALRGVEANEEQRQRVKAVVGDALRDLAATAKTHHENREAFAAELGKPAVDRDALERLRQAEMQLAEEASRRIVQAVADAADALTPEQRRALLDHAHRFAR
jgi:Spy/CpxP family protein refolding chaperone